MTDDTEVLGTDSAAVVEQSLMAFGAGMTLKSRTDVKNSFQFASRVANKRYNSEKEGEAWFNQFLTVMQDCGWVTARRSYEREQSESQSLKVGAIAFKAMHTIGTAALGGPIAEAFSKVAEKALEKLGMVTEAQELMKRNLKDRNLNNIGLASCLETSEGEVVLAMSAVDIGSSKLDLDMAVFEWHSTSGETYSGMAVLSFNKDMYEKVRTAIEEKLGVRMLENVLDYEI